MILALTQGDPSGIGIDLALDLWIKSQKETVPAFIFLADPAVVRRRAELLKLDIPLQISEPEGALSLFQQALPIAPLHRAARGEAGVSHPEDAFSVIEAVERAATWCAQGRVCALVTNPISKAALYEVGFSYPGHTEWLAALANRPFGLSLPPPVMLLWSPFLSTVPLTIHLPLREACDRLTLNEVVRQGRLVHSSLQHLFNMPHPRLALAGLNPHAGEDGHLGWEEKEILEPACRILCAEGLNLTGPYPADSLFQANHRALYDVALCPTHDQALIPIKTLAFDQAVNVTLGLPFVRTSPDHGTAYKLAGTGQASSESLNQALRLAARLASPRMFRPDLS